MKSLSGVTPAYKGMFFRFRVEMGRGSRGGFLEPGKQNSRIFVQVYSSISPIVKNIPLRGQLRGDCPYISNRLAIAEF